MNNIGMAKKYLYEGKYLSLKQLKTTFKKKELEIINKYYTYNGGGFFYNNKPKSIKNEKKIISLEDAKKFIESIKTPQDLDDFKNVIDNIKKGNVTAYNKHDNFYIYKDHYDNIWKFTGVGIAMGAILSGVSAGTIIPALTVLGLTISWFCSKYYLNDEMQKVLIILLFNSVHMKKNINKIKEIIINKNQHKKIIDETDEEFNNKLLNEVSSLFDPIEKQINSFVLYLFNCAEPTAFIEFLLFLEYSKIKENITFDKINVSTIINTPTENYNQKIKRHFNKFKNMFVVQEKYRIMIRESNICLSMFSLLMSDVLIYSMNSNLIGYKIILETTDKKDIDETFPETTNIETKDPEN
jgi:hypothetical protein